MSAGREPCSGPKANRSLSASQETTTLLRSELQIRKGHHSIHSPRPDHALSQDCLLGLTPPSRYPEDDCPDL